MFTSNIKISHNQNMAFGSNKIYLNLLCQIMSLWYSLFFSGLPSSERKPRSLETPTRSCLIFPLLLPWPWLLIFSPSVTGLQLYTGSLAFLSIPGCTCSSLSLESFSSCWFLSHLCGASLLDWQLPRKASPESPPVLPSPPSIYFSLNSYHHLK